MNQLVRVAGVLALCMGCGAAPARQRAGGLEAAAGEVPETPSRVAVVDAIAAVTDDVRACGRGVPGEVSVRLEFASSGELTDAAIDPRYHWVTERPAAADCEAIPNSGGNWSCQRVRPAVPEVDECVLGAVRATRLPPFRQPAFVVNFPFRY